MSTFKLTLDPDQRRAIATWIDALESGVFTQTQKSLRRPINDNTIGYCCLGVACELDASTHWENNIAVVDMNDATYNSYDHPDLDGQNDIESDTELPGVLRERMGITSQAQLLLIQLNDNGAPFTAIAAFLRSIAGFLPPTSHATAMDQIV